MKRAAVAEISFYENVIEHKIVIVQNDATWKDAYLAYLGTEVNSDIKKWILDMPDNLNKARLFFFDGEMDISVIWIDDRLP